MRPPINTPDEIADPFLAEWEGDARPIASSTLVASHVDRFHVATLADRILKLTAEVRRLRALSSHPDEETSEDSRGATCAACGAHFSASGADAGVELEVEHLGDSLHRARYHSVPTDGEGRGE